MVNSSAAAANEGGIEAGTSAITDAMMDVDVQVEKGSSEEKEVSEHQYFLSVSPYSTISYDRMEQVHAAIAFKNEYTAVKKEEF